MRRSLLFAAALVGSGSALAGTPADAAEPAPVPAADADSDSDIPVDTGEAPPSLPAGPPQLSPEDQAQVQGGSGGSEGGELGEVAGPPDAEDGPSPPGPEDAPGPPGVEQETSPPLGSDGNAPAGAPTAPNIPAPAGHRPAVTPPAPPAPPAAKPPPRPSEPGTRRPRSPSQRPRACRQGTPATPPHAPTVAHLTRPVAPAGVQASPPVAPAATIPATQRPQQTAPDNAGGHHVVRAGESLTAIARKILGAGASDAEIAGYVKRLWSLNSDRIGSGDPDLIHPGDRLRLPRR